MIDALLFQMMFCYWERKSFASESLGDSFDRAKQIHLSPLRGGKCIVHSVTMNAITSAKYVFRYDMSFDDKRNND